MLHQFAQYLQHIDVSISTYLHGFVGKNAAVDQTIYEINGLHLIKGGMFAAAIYFAWFLYYESRTNRERVMRMIGGGVMAVVFGRALQVLLPGRLRPIHDPAVGFFWPYRDAEVRLHDMSSMPSDHAVLFFALAAGLAACDRRLGVLAFVWAALVATLPRIYTGAHFASDIVVGALIGIVIMVIALTVPLPRLAVDRVLAWEQTHRAAFYALSFLVVWQVATVGADARRLLDGMEKLTSLLR